MPYNASFKYKDRVTGEIITITDLYYETNDEKAIIEEIKNAFQLVGEIILTHIP